MTLLTKSRVATKIDQPTVAAEGNLELDNREDLKTDAVAEASWVQVTKFGGYRGDDDSMHHLQRCDAKFRLLTEGGWWFITNRQITFGNGTNLKTDPFCSRLKSFGSRHFLPLLTFTVGSVERCSELAGKPCSGSDGSFVKVFPLVRCCGVAS